MSEPILNTPAEPRNRALARLRKTIALLASDEAGEVQAAARAAARLFPALDCPGWTALVDKAFAEPERAPCPASEPPRDPRPVMNPAAMIGWCLARPDFLSEWEVNFVRSLRAWGRPLSPRQVSRLEEITRRIEARVADAERSA